MDLWKAERLNAPADFTNSSEGGSTRSTGPPLMTPAQFTTASQNTPGQTPLQHPPFRADAPSRFNMDRWRPTHLKRQLEKPLQPRPDHRLLEEEISCSALLQQEVGMLKEERELMRGEMDCLKGRRIEQEELQSELNSYKSDLRMSQDQLMTEKSEHESERRHLEKELQDSKQEIANLQEKLELQISMTDAMQEVTSLRTQMQEVISERDSLRDQQRVLQSSLLEQSECVQKLRTYIGSNITERKEEEELRCQIQHLEKENEALSLSVQLLNVRVNAASDILAIQEKELGEQEQTEPLFSGSKAGQILSVWRQKVFMLLVQLQSRDVELHAEKAQLHSTVSSLKQEVESLQSQNSILQHHLEDKTAQLELERVQSQGIQQQLDGVLQENAELKACNMSSEASLKRLGEMAHRVMSAVELKTGQMEAAQSSISQLNQRLAFAAKRLDTVLGLLLRKEALLIKSLQAEVLMLSTEREKLTQELKRTPELIQASLCELQQQRERELGLLREALARSKEELEASESLRMETLRQCEEKERTGAELQAEAQRLQLQCDSGKVSEVERVCAEKLREMEAQLNTARREHTKAVVALRQVQRQVEREKEQMKEAEGERTEHTLKQITHLHKQLKDKDKDCNLLMAVVQEQGLMNEYKRLRRAAIKTATDVQTLHRKPERSSPAPERLLGALQALSAAVMGSSEEEDDEEEGQAFPDTQTPSCADTHKE
ncbi:hypothetical protein DNTS_023078 [Danionella cerebrum]|uniref:Coiled-coil alpha-helical rod protein 1 n=1 Tax=Danionella cerebrum TaxID=2873325 RepID=A0A553QZJ9_9TELE|nr:hypothetical protein DNTS_023078 [Danionella translucida]